MGVAQRLGARSVFTAGPQKAAAKPSIIRRKAQSGQIGLRIAGSPNASAHTRPNEACSCSFIRRGHIHNMFSYRHAFHAGNHADVLKHIGADRDAGEHLLEKEAALTVGRHSKCRRRAVPPGRRLRRHQRRGGRRHPPLARPQTDGPRRLSSGACNSPRSRPRRPAASAPNAPLAPAIQAYLDLGARLSTRTAGRACTWASAPSSTTTNGCATTGQAQPVRGLHPDRRRRTLDANMAKPRQLEAAGAGRSAPKHCGDRSRLRQRHQVPAANWPGQGAPRADAERSQSYETRRPINGQVLDLIGESLKRFATGTYAVWYPIIPRPEAHDLPRRLKTMATKAGKSWLHATLTVKSSKVLTTATGDQKRPRPARERHVPDQSALHAQGAAQPALEQLKVLLAQDRHAALSLDSGG